MEDISGHESILGKQRKWKKENLQTLLVNVLPHFAPLLKLAYTFLLLLL